MITDEQMADGISQQMNLAAVGGRGDSEKRPDNDKAPAKHGDANDDPGADDWCWCGKHKSEHKELGKCKRLGKKHTGECRQSCNHDPHESNYGTPCAPGVEGRGGEAKAGRSHLGGGLVGGRSCKPAGGSSARGETSTKGSSKDSGKQTLPDCI
ncbi:hypothetical protein ABVK25_012093 [Lepraria finkii]|uniref:Uncharacterized protein n=1 Tax=Lepraria finkii TaxID=1340010 RepID=A0ABR4AI56_9LECA